MTEVTGRSFLSYRRTRRAEATLLIEAQHDIGIPTWQDVRDLDEEHTEEEIRRILSDPTTANAVLWLTPDVQDSTMIQRVEIPGIMARHKRRNGFFVVPIAAGSMTYEMAGSVASRHLNIDDLGEWNLRRVDADPIGTQEAAMVARRILRRRVRALHRALSADDPLQVIIHSRTPAPFQVGTALTIDWRHRFEDREATQSTWEDYLLPALQVIASAFQEHTPRRRVELRGLASLPTVTALGCAFLSTRQISLGWWQYTPGRPEQLWTLEAPHEPSGFEAKTVPSDTRADDLAVLISVTDDVEPAFGATRSALPAFRAITKIAHPEEPRHVLPGPGQAAHLAQLIINEIREARRIYQLTGTVHLFMAAPAGLAMMIGQLLNTFGVVQTYEHVPSGAEVYYRPAAMLQPSRVILVDELASPSATPIAPQSSAKKKLSKIIRRRDS